MHQNDDNSMFDDEPLDLRDVLTAIVWIAIFFGAIFAVNAFIG